MSKNQQEDQDYHDMSLNENISHQITSYSLAVDALLSPNIFDFIDYDTLVSYKLISKLIYTSIKDPQLDKIYHEALCISFASKYGLYMSPSLSLTLGPRKYLMEYLLELKYKWNVIEKDEHNQSKLPQDFKIKVACRFRPGNKGVNNLCLPLHQYLKVKRQQKQIAISESSNDNNNIVVGESDPEEFLDPLLGALMNDPVLLPTSNKIVDRSVALQCCLRGGKDPFNNQRLTVHMLIPQDDLLLRIKEWKQKKALIDYSLSVTDIKSLIDESSSATDPTLLATLMEIERLAQVANKAEHDALHESASNADTQNSTFEIDDFNVDVLDVLPPQDDAIISLNGVNGNSTASNSGQSSNKAIVGAIPSPDDNTDSFKAKTIENPRVVDISKSKANVTMNLPGSGVKTFQFQKTFDDESNQTQVYNECSEEMIVSMLNGYNACVLCYGQTGSGKTYTFFGPEEALYLSYNHKGNISDKAGIVMRTCHQIFQAREKLRDQGINLLISAQYVEIYDEQVTDLLTGINHPQSGHNNTLANNTITIRRETGELNGAIEVTLHDMDNTMEILRIGQARKRFAETAMNDHSSRSHTAFIIHATQTSMDSNDKLIKSKLLLLDLAGSERIKKSKVTGLHLREAVGINYSLHVLGKVISSLVKQRSHVPYFESKLTTMLKSAFGGNCRTLTIINCRPEESHGDETLQSLRFGERCSMISNRTKTAATSLSTALQSIDEAIATVKDQIHSLETKGKTQVDSYSRLLLLLKQMERRRDMLIVD